MAITEADLEAKRQLAAGLRNEIRSIQAETADAHSQAELELTNAQLDAEIARLERERDVAEQHRNGSVERAMKLMEAAVEAAGAPSPNEVAMTAENTATSVQMAKAEERAADAKLEAQKAADTPPTFTPPAPGAAAAMKTGGNK